MSQQQQQQPDFTASGRARFIPSKMTGGDPTYSTTFEVSLAEPADAFPDWDGEFDAQNRIKKSNSTNTNIAASTTKPTAITAETTESKQATTTSTTSSPQTNPASSTGEIKESPRDPASTTGEKKKHHHHHHKKDKKAAETTPKP